MVHLHFRSLNNHFHGRNDLLNPTTEADPNQDSTNNAPPIVSHTQPESSTDDCSPPNPR